MNRSPILTALFHPINLTMFALAVAAGLCSAWWLAPIGFLFWVAMVIVIARDPGLKITFTRQNRQPLAQRFQVRFDRLDRARISIFNAMGQANPQLQHTVQPVQTELENLVEHCYQLSLRMSALDNHFAVQRLSNDFNKEIEQLKQRLEQDLDPATKHEYEQTIQSMQARQKQLKDLASILNRFEAQLTGATNAVDSVVTGIVSLKGRSPQQAGEKIAPLLNILQAEQSELEKFDEDIQNFSVV